jgi:hypothetical protein
LEGAERDDLGCIVKIRLKDGNDVGQEQLYEDKDAAGEAECLCVLVVAVHALISPRIATWYICFIIEYCTYHASRMRDAA